MNLSHFKNSIHGIVTATLSLSLNPCFWYVRLGDIPIASELHHAIEKVENSLETLIYQ